MPRPGEYSPDPTEKIVHLNDLPKPKIKKRSRVRKKCPCPFCKRPARQHDVLQRSLHHLGDLDMGRPVKIILRYSQHYCCKCKKYFSVDTSSIAPPKSDYTNAVIELAIRLVVDDDLPYRSASWHLWRDHRVFVPFATIQNWVEAAGEKIYSKIESNDYLDAALKGFSGYIAVDEVYDASFCILSLVDSRENIRLMFRVLKHNPSAEDILELLQAFRQILESRELTLQGITTDGSSLYTEPVRTVFPGVRHQICEFHVKKEVNKSVIKAVAQTRQRLAKKKVKRSKRGRPSTKGEKAIVRKNDRIQAKIGALFEHRYLFVQKELSAKERKKFLEITRGMPELRKLREFVEEVYRLYDRRCRRVTALRKLHQLRVKLKRFKWLSEVLKKIESPTLARSFEFLEDKELPSTSNSVERGNRRFRKMQKTVYRVRSFDNICRRISLDMVRDARLPIRCRVIRRLHEDRNKHYLPP